MTHCTIPPAQVQHYPAHYQPAIDDMRRWIEQSGHDTTDITDYAIYRAICAMECAIAMNDWHDLPDKWTLAARWLVETYGGAA